MGSVLIVLVVWLLATLIIVLFLQGTKSSDGTSWSAIGINPDVIASWTQVGKPDAQPDFTRSVRENPDFKSTLANVYIVLDTRFNRVIRVAYLHRNVLEVFNLDFKQKKYYEGFVDFKEENEIRAFMMQCLMDQA